MSTKDASAEPPVLPSALPECTIDEDPAFEVDRYGIVFHYVYRDSSGLKSSDPTLDSIEHDILAYAFRNRRPFHSAVLKPPADCECVEVSFPPITEYIAEGAAWKLVTRPAGLDDDGTERRRSFAVCASRTVFSDHHAILHLGLTPCRNGDANRPPSTLNEYDLVKLLKLWDGGEGVSEDDELAMREQLHFFRRGSKQHPFTLDALAREVLEKNSLAPEGAAVQLRAGTIQLRLGERWGSIYEHLAPLRKGETACDGAFSERNVPRETWNDLLALQTTLCGLLNGDNVDDAEMRDSFLLPMNLTADALLAVNKGTMLMVSDECRLGETMGPILGVNPFLSIPHAALIYNEETLRGPLEGLRQLDEENCPESQLRNLEKDLDRALQRLYLPNVFHYSRERTLFEHGMESRRVGALQEEASRGLETVRTLLRERMEGKKNSQDSFLELFVLILTLIQVLGNYEQLYHLATEHWWGFATCAIVTLLAPFPIHFAATRRGAPMKPRTRLLVIVTTGLLFWIALYWWLIYLAPEPPEGHRPHENVPAATASE